MEQARMALRRATKKLNVAYKQAQSNHLLFLVLFAIVVFFGVFVLKKIYKVRALHYGWLLGLHLP